MSNIYESSKERLANIPIKLGSWSCNIFASQSADWNDLLAGDLLLFDNFSGLRADFFKYALVIFDLIDLIERHDNATNTKHIENFQMSLGLRPNSLIAVYDQNTEVGFGCTRGHILEKLQMTRSINQDELVSVEFKIHSSGINTDALLLFFLQRIEQKCGLELQTLVRANLLDMSDSIFWNASAFQQNAPEQS